MIPIKLTIAICITAGLFASCSHTKPLTQIELAPLGQENPSLLPLEHAHKVKVNLRAAPPSSLSKDDLVEIYALVGRVPGLRKYEIELIAPATFHPGMFDVCTSPLIVTVQKNVFWSVFVIR